MTTLAHWFEQSGFSKGGFATAVTERARASGYRHVNPDASRVRAWLRGERPRDPVPQLLADVLSTRCGKALSPEDLGYEEAADVLAAYRGPAETLADLSKVTATRLAAGPSPPAAPLTPQGGAEALLRGLEQWYFVPPAPLPQGAGRHLGATDADRIREYTALFRKLDNAHGGASTLHAATGQLAWAVSSVRGGRFRETAGRQLFREVADLAGVVGWMAHDSAQWPSAVRYLTLAVHASRESGDRELTAHLLQCLARVTAYLGRPDLAADHIALAIYGARDAHPVLRAGLHSLSARFAALRGREKESVREIRTAGEIFHEDSDTSLPEFTAYLDEAELDSTLGEVLLFLSRSTSKPAHAQEAVRLLGSAVRTRHPSRARSKAFDHIASARSLLVVGDHEGALEETKQALEVGASLESERVRRRFDDLATEAAKMPSDSASTLRSRIASSQDDAL